MQPGRQAQGFTTTIDANLTGLSIFVPSANNFTSITMQLRNGTNGTPDGGIIASLPVNLTGGNSWSECDVQPGHLFAQRALLHLHAERHGTIEWVGANTDREHGGRVGEY